MSDDRYGDSENRPPRKGKAFRKFEIGDLVDVQDHKDTWYEAEIKDIDCDDRGNINRVLVHFFFWDNSYDEWYRPTSNKIAAHCSKIWTLGKRLRVGHRIDVFDTHPKQNKYLPCTVIEEDRHNILIHYASHSSHWDEWLPRTSGRIAPYGHRSKKKSRYPYDYDRIQEIHYASSRKSYRKRGSSSMDTSSLTRFKNKLATIGEVPLTVKNIRGDGNCLFRAISHQIYGTSEHHQMIREKVVEYMRIEKDFFRNFIIISDEWVGDNDDESAHLKYFRDMNQLGTWGGDPEIQACVEIYNRPINLYYFKETDGTVNIIKRGPDEISVTSGGRNDGRSSSRVGASQRNTARLSHLDSQEASIRLGETLRLHYEGSNHYNSIVSEHGHRRSGSSPTLEPGKIEDTALANARARRRHYESLSKDNHEGKVDEGGQKGNDSNSATTSSSGIQVEEERLIMLMRGGVKFLPVQMDDDILFIDNPVPSNSRTMEDEERELQLALEVSKRNAEQEDENVEDELSRALKASMDLHNNLTAVSYDEDEAMAKAIAESQGFRYDSEEYQIQLAIAESKRLAEQETGNSGRKK